MSAPTSGPQLTFLGHLEELRRRLGICLIVFLAAVGVSFVQIERVIRWLQRPAERFLPHFAYFSPTEPIIAYVKVSVLVGLMVSMPVFLAHVWGFVRGGLTAQERSYGLAFIWWGSGLFVTGAAFGYYVLLPASLQVLLGIGRSYLEPMISIDQYLSFVTTLVFWCGVIFELPAIIFLLAKVGVVTTAWLRQQRPYAILILVTVAAIVTPTTDPVNLLLLSIPLIFLYEISILLIQLSVRRRQE